MCDSEIRQHGRKILRARYVFPVAGRPIASGTVTIEGQRIVAVGQCGGQSHDLGNVAILPGLVNAHAHLDFSDLAEPLGRPGISLPDWIRLVMADRRERADKTRQPVALGLAEGLRQGVTTVGDIAQPGWSTADVAGSPLGVTAFLELIAPKAERVAGARELARTHLQAAAAPSTSWQSGLSPHTPFTVHPELLAAVIGLSARERVPLAMHLAESQEELELLRHGTGPLRGLLEGLDAYDPTTIPVGTRPLDYLRLLASAHRTLVIHGNYLDDEEVAFLAANAARMAVVYCPRTHAWFARGTYPLQEMLAAGVSMALGTDGRGSSPDLSLLAEMRFVARQYPGVGLDRVLQLGTIDGARALGRDRDVGSLEPGKQADLAIVALPNHDAADPHELLFRSDEPVIGCYCRGRQLSGE
jgi:aminodeoxyfutalosine deaminase